MKKIVEHELDFETEGKSIEVYSDARKFIIPVPQFPDDGEPLLYPESDPKSGQRITDYKGRPMEGNGVVFYNEKDRAWAATQGDGTSVVIVNLPTDEHVKKFEALIESHGKTIDEFTITEFKQLLEDVADVVSQDKNPITGEPRPADMYHSSREYIQKEMMPENGELSDPPYGVFVREPTVCKATLIEGKGQYFRSAASPQLFSDGAVLIEHNNEVRLVQTDAFLLSYKHQSNGEDYNKGDDITAEQLPKQGTARWYIPDVGRETLPDGVAMTIFDPQHYNETDKTADDLERTFALNGKATGVYQYNFSPERLALQETIIAMSAELQMADKDHFVDAFKKIHKDYIQPAIEDQRAEFETLRQDIEEHTRQAAADYFAADQNPSILSEEYENIAVIDAAFQKNLKAFTKELESLYAEIGERRPTRNQRARREVLEDTLHYMENNYEQIIVGVAAEQNIIAANKALVADIIGSAYDSQTLLGTAAHELDYQTLTLKDDQDRTSLLVVGGAGSGKGTITDLVQKERVTGEQTTPDIVAINPDLYKKLLLPFEEFPEDYRALHGSVTHFESSIVFDGVAERWQDMASEGHAPDLLMDVARAGEWMISVASTGNTKIDIHSPVLPAKEALGRAFDRGKQTGRDMPSPLLLSTHKDQPVITLDALKDDRINNVTMYDTNVDFGDPVTQVYHKDNAQEYTAISNIVAMYEGHFIKNDLNIHARTDDSLDQSTPESVAAMMFEYAKTGPFEIYDDDHNVIATFKCKDQWPQFDVLDADALMAQIDNDQLTYDLVKGLLLNDVVVSGDGVQPLIDQAFDEYRDAQKPQEQPASMDGVLMQQGYIKLLHDLVDHGKRIIKDSDVYVCNLDEHAEAFNSDTIDICTINPDNDKEASTYSYQKGADNKQSIIVIDGKIHDTEEKRNAVIETIKREGSFTGDGVYMTKESNLVDDYRLVEGQNPDELITCFEPDPTAVRVALKLDTEITIPVKWDDSYHMEENSSIIIREKDLQQLRDALKEYDLGNRDRSLFVDESGLSVFDAYGTDAHFVDDNYLYLPMQPSEYHALLSRVADEGTDLIRTELNSRGDVDKFNAIQLKPDEDIIIPSEPGSNIGRVVPGGSWLAINNSDTGNRSFASFVTGGDGRTARVSEDTKLTVLDPITVATSFQKGPERDINQGATLER